MVNRLKGKNDFNKNLLFNIFGTFIIKGGALCISVLSMPIYIKFFNDSKVLGLWFTMLSIMTWILSCDLGIGNGLRNNLVEAIVANDKIKIRKYIVSAYAISFIVAITIGGIGYWVIGLLDWNHFFNIPQLLLQPQTLIFSMRAIFIGIVIQFVLKLVTSILYALQKPAITNLLALISSLAQVLIVLFLPNNNIEENLKILAIVYGCCINIPLLIATIKVFTWELHFGIPQFRDCDFRFAINILKLGGTFFFVQILFMILMNTNEIIITRLYGSEYVVDYQVYNKIFTVAGSLFMIALTPLWSAITKAYNENNNEWIMNIYRKLNYIVCIAVLAELGIVLFIKPIIFAWIGNDIVNIEYHIALLFAIYGGIYIYQSALSTLACGLGQLRIQAIFYAIAVIMKIIFVYITFWGNLSWISLILINIIVLLPYCLVQPKVLTHYLKKR